MRPLSLLTLAALIVAGGYVVLLLYLNPAVLELLRIILPRL